MHTGILTRLSASSHDPLELAQQSGLNQECFCLNAIQQSDRANQKSLG